MLLAAPVRRAPRAQSPRCSLIFDTFLFLFDVFLCHHESDYTAAYCMTSCRNWSYARTWVLVQEVAACTNQHPCLSLRAATSTYGFLYMGNRFAFPHLVAEIDVRSFRVSTFWSSLPKDRDLLQYDTGVSKETRTVPMLWLVMHLLRTGKANRGSSSSSICFAGTSTKPHTFVPMWCHFSLDGRSPRHQCNERPGIVPCTVSFIVLPCVVFRDSPCR